LVLSASGSFGIVRFEKQIRTLPGVESIGSFTEAAFH